MTRRALAALAVAATFLSGCGGQSSRQDFLRAADARCARARKEIDRLPAPRSLRDLRLVADQALVVSGRTLAELRALEPPEDLRRRWTTLLERLDGQLQTLRDVRGAAAAGDRRAARRLIERGARQDRDVSQRAGGLGLRACGRRPA